MNALQCRDLLGSLSDYVEGNAQAELCAEIERHLAECEDCRVVVDTLKKTIYLVHTLEEEPLPEDVRTRLFHSLNLDDFLSRKIADNPAPRQTRSDPCR